MKPEGRVKRTSSGQANNVREWPLTHIQFELAIEGIADIKVVSGRLLRKRWEANEFGWDGRIGWGARKDIAFHESGHAVARVLSIGRVGITNANAIRWIQIDGGNPHVSVMALPNKPELKEAGERLGLKEGTPWTLEQRLTVFSLMKIDPLESASVRFFETAAGAAAEAKFRQIPFDSVWRDNQ